EAERGRLRDAIARFGEALGATHDADQLLRVIVETALEATNASYACLNTERGQGVRAGDPDAVGDRIELPLQAGRTNFGTLVLADLDDFKGVNDAHGHPVGDAVLREFADVLRSTVRDSDLAGRWGGEEFVLLLSGTGAEGGAQLAERVRRKLAERTILAPDGTRTPITAS